jgi:sigma-B regulation protein RsbU (phosphoserine phosphatase)
MTKRRLQEVYRKYVNSASAHAILKLDVSQPSSVRPSPMHRKSPLATVFLGLLILWVLLSALGIARAFTTLIAVAELAIGAILLFRLCRYLVRQSIWRLRNRLILNYILIGVIPVILILVFILVGGYIVAGQIAVFLVTSELDRHTQGLNEPAQILSWTTQESRPRILNGMAPFVRNHFPHVQMLVHAEDEFRYPADAPIKTPPLGWDSTSGLVVKDGRYYSWAHVSRNSTEVVMLEPVTNRMLSELVPNLAAVQLYERDARLTAHPESEDEAVHIPPQRNSLDREVYWAARVEVADWDRPGRMTQRVLIVTTRYFALLNVIFGDKFVDGQAGLWVLGGVGVLFLIVEMMSLITGISLTRTITGAVHNLYEGTRKVTAGDFSHRIEVNGRDQLADLGRSFNSMTENLERLFAVEKEKERLQSELEIAKEVQNQLFPKDVPTLRTMELTGVCKPARMVSGDYYDFLCLEGNRVALAIGDVAGKGISAALLMASIQSIMRSQLTAGSAAFAAAVNGKSAYAFSTCNAVSQLNKQLFASTSPEKFATFCFGIYDEDRRVLSYTNAGHVPPLLIRGETATALEVTGTVVGAFPMVLYEERTVALTPGDMLVAYTDGIAEPENAYDEEFGCERLTDLLLRYQKESSHEIIGRVMEAVRQWTNAPELPDDMTLLVAKIQ